MTELNPQEAKLRLANLRIKYAQKVILDHGVEIERLQKVIDRMKVEILDDEKKVEEAQREIAELLGQAK